MDRMLITKVRRTSETRADLIGKGHRYRDIICFDLAELGDAGVDYERLPIGQEVPVKFWAYYQESDRQTSKGNPYLDLIRVEPVNLPATTTSVDNSAILAELRAIRSLLARALQIDDTAIDESGGGVPPEDDGPEDLPEEETPFDAGPLAPDPQPLNDAQAYRAFNQQVGAAIREGTITTDQASELARNAAAIGWRDALSRLLDLIAAAQEAQERVPA